MDQIWSQNGGQNQLKNVEMTFLWQFLEFLERNQANNHNMQDFPYPLVGIVMIHAEKLSF